MIVLNWEVEKGQNWLNWPIRQNSKIKVNKRQYQTSCKRVTFQLALTCFVEYLSESLGSDMPEGGPEAWKKLFTAVELILDIELKRGCELKKQWTDN